MIFSKTSGIYLQIVFELVIAATAIHKKMQCDCIYNFKRNLSKVYDFQINLRVVSKQELIENNLHFYPINMILDIYANSKLS